jgi:Primase C terminal 1 (PriCT-1)
MIVHHRPKRMQAQNLPEHDPAACPRCEGIPPETPRRHWKEEPKRRAWHLIADGPDLMARLPKIAHFATVLAYTPGPHGTPAHYRGPLYWEYDADDPVQALEDLRRCLQVLDIEQELPLEAVHVWHSGGRGYHVTIPPLVLGAEAGHPALPRIYEAMIEQLFPANIAPTLDRGIYSGGMGRMWRLPHRRRADTGCYKVPLAMREVRYQPHADIEALTRRRRKHRYWPDDAELSPRPALVSLYHQVAATIGMTPRASPHLNDGERIPTGQRNCTLASLAGSMRRRGMSQQAIVAALAAENEKRCDPPLPDTEVQAIARSIGRYAPSGHHAPPDSDARHLLLGARYLAQGVTRG